MTMINVTINMHVSNLDAFMKRNHDFIDDGSMEITGMRSQNFTGDPKKKVDDFKADVKKSLNGGGQGMRKYREPGSPRAMERVLQIVQSRETAHIQDIQKTLERDYAYKQSSASPALAQLTSRGYLERVGEDKSGVYRVTEIGKRHSCDVLLPFDTTAPVSR